jgi:hypothetical protein
MLRDMRTTTSPLIARMTNSVLTAISKWHFADTRQNTGQQGLPALNEKAARECLRPGIAAPDLATVKDFLRFYIAIRSDCSLTTSTIMNLLST